MIKILDTALAQVSPSFITVSWTLEPTTESFLDYHIDIYRSELPSLQAADYDLVASGISPYYHGSYNDITISGLTTKYATYNYKIAVINNTTEETVYSLPKGLSVTSDNDARYIIKHRELVLNRLSGADFILLKRKTFGTFCTACYDETLQRQSDSKCTVCFDTKYTGGYYLPHRFRAQMNNNPPRHVLTTYGYWQDSDAIITMSNTPVLSPTDIIVDRLGVRWRVVTIKTVNKAMFLISQQAQVRQVEIDNIVYSFPISW